jgi:uncharacterized protein YehS (DUF1456 family)
MNRNDILRRIRYVFDFGDDQMIKLFALGGLAVTRVEVSDWLKRDTHKDYRACRDIQLAHFLNGLIIEKRGARDGPPPVAERRLNNNIVLRKLKIALSLTSDEMIEVLSLANSDMSKSEVSAFFRRTDHKHYRECMDQVLRNFLEGLRLRHRPDASTPE